MVVFTSAKISDGTIATGDLDDAVTGAKIAIQRWNLVSGTTGLYKSSYSIW